MVETVVTADVSVTDDYDDDYEKYGKDAGLSVVTENVGVIVNEDNDSFTVVASNHFYVILKLSFNDPHWKIYKYHFSMCIIISHLNMVMPLTSKILTYGSLSSYSKQRIKSKMHENVQSESVS